MAVNGQLAKACTVSTCGDYKQFSEYYNTFVFLHPRHYIRLYPFNYDTAVVLSNAYANAIWTQSGITYFGREARRQYYMLYGRYTSEGIWRNMARHTGILIDLPQFSAWVMPVCLCVSHVEYIGAEKDIEVEVEWEMPHPFLIDVNEDTCYNFMMAYIVDIIIESFGNISLIEAINRGDVEFKIEPLEKIYLHPVGDSAIELINKGGSVEVYVKRKGKRVMRTPSYEYDVKSHLIEVPVDDYMRILTRSVYRNNYIPPEGVE